MDSRETVDVQATCILFYGNLFRSKRISLSEIALDKYGHLPNLVGELTVFLN